MNSKLIQHALYNQFGNAAALMIPNYTPAHWFECDMLRVTKAGFMDEFEIKVSVADFKVDALKGPTEHERARMASYSEADQKRFKFEFRSKHQRLAEGDTRGPCRFWFVMPEEIASKVEIPSWAGMITVGIYRKHVRLLNLYPHHPSHRKAPQLHKAKVDPAVLTNARGVFYHRYWNIRRGHSEEGAA